MGAPEVHSLPLGDLEPYDDFGSATLVVDGEQEWPVLVADTASLRSQGLMSVTDLGPWAGMVFVWEEPTDGGFWMKDTPLSLDIIFVGVDGRVLNVAANTEPYSTLSVSSAGLTSAVLELRGGRAAELGIEPGDKVEYSLPE